MSNCNCYIPGWQNNKKCNSFCNKNFHSDKIQINQTTPMSNIKQYKCVCENGDQNNVSNFKQCNKMCKKKIEKYDLIQSAYDTPKSTSPSSDPNVIQNPLPLFLQQNIVVHPNSSQPNHSLVKNTTNFFHKIEQGAKNLFKSHHHKEHFKMNEYSSNQIFGMDRNHYYSLIVVQLIAWILMIIMCLEILNVCHLKNTLLHPILIIIFVLWIFLGCYPVFGFIIFIILILILIIFMNKCKK